jgi:prepilin signal peptidase PulO-like enzyme (type II secretory pathway)
MLPVTSFSGLALIVAGLFGVIIGSFLNVVILRFNPGRGSGGRSMCLSCAKTLTWVELIPVLSFVLLGRRCRGCKAKVSWQYPLVELATAALFALLWYVTLPVYYTHGLSVFLIQLVLLATIFSTYVVIFVYDLYHKIIPDVFSYTAAIAAFLLSLSVFFFETGFTSSIYNLLAGPILFLPFWILWRVSNGRWMGLGDGKLALSIGWLLGLSVGTTALLFAVWLGAIIGVLLVLMGALKRRGSGITMKAEIPFAPFLLVATLIAFLMPIDIFSLTLLFSLY